MDFLTISKKKLEMKFYTKTYSKEVSSKEERQVDDKLNPPPYPRDSGLCEKDSADYRILSKVIKKEASKR